jgi:hypothetical protein
VELSSKDGSQEKKLQERKTMNKKYVVKKGGKYWTGGWRDNADWSYDIYKAKIINKNNVNLLCGERFVEVNIEEVYK